MNVVISIVCTWCVIVSLRDNFTRVYFPVLVCCILTLVEDGGTLVQGSKHCVEHIIMSRETFSTEEVVQITKYVKTSRGKVL